MSKYTRHTLQKLEDLFRELKIAVRYEKGNFQSGYCIVVGKDIVIVNKFFDVEARINTLIEILEQGKIDMTALPVEMLDSYHKLKKSLLKTA